MINEIGSVSRIIPQVPVNQIKRQTYVPDKTRKADETKPENEQLAKEENDEDSLQKEDVVAVSDFGDTVQFSDEGKDQYGQDQDGSVKVNGQKRERLENFSIFPQAKEDEKEVSDSQFAGKTKEKDKAEDEDKSKTEDFSVTTNSYAGYTDARLEQMYLQGEISRYDYEAEIEKREQEEQETEKQQETNAKISGKADSEIKSAERAKSAIEAAFSEKASKTIDPKMRLDIMQKLEQLGKENEEQEDQIKFQLHVG